MLDKAQSGGMSVTGPPSRRAIGQSENPLQSVGVLESHWESADGKKTAQIVILCSKVKEVLAKMHEAHHEGILELSRLSTRAGNVNSSCT